MGAEANANENVPKATLTSLDLIRLSCNRDPDGPGIPEGRKGNLNLENTISIKSYDEEKKTFLVSVASVVKGNLVDEKDEVVGVLFEGESAWIGTFELKNKVKHSAIEKHAAYYANQMYPLVRATLVDSFFRMGFNLDILPWTPNQESD